ncbi:hypothetical protein C8N46_103247 [Kordia periserrulae]|uniref:Uncharacterized protein n=1 Tax=Kordia periserrulae TaxID=701523 RepID=A0A2T6C1H0_9FLAO|nr:hypothetical protein [Kordia periserrulae]PTX62149.1 hypothetical protein C8N46_103247 [Kordia periserrulae]
MNEQEKHEFLEKIVHSKEATEQLLSYCENKFIPAKTKVATPDSYLETWEAYVAEASEKGVISTLKKYIPQLQFPVEKNISSSEVYKNATLRGRVVESDKKLQLRNPERIALELYKTPLIGKVPVMTVSNKDDFYTICCALGNKNEPKELPKSMGALFINGLNNWHRIKKLQTQWQAQHPYGNWNEEFKKNILPNPHLYKDKLIVLSISNYSNVSHTVVGKSETDWQKISVAIRKEHECAHLFTLQQYGTMANNMHDELIADYAGITKALGYYNKDWFLQFIGLENYPAYRKGGRLENYQEPVQLSTAALKGLQHIIKNAATAIEKFDHSLGNNTTDEERMRRIQTLCEVDLLTMASVKGEQQLIETYNTSRISPYHGKEKRKNNHRSQRYSPTNL